MNLPYVVDRSPRLLVQTRIQQPECCDSDISIVVQPSNRYTSTVIQMELKRHLQISMATNTMNRMVAVQPACAELLLPIYHVG